MAALDDELLHGARWKFTLGEYLYAGYAGTDLNLRWHRGDADVWLGTYHDPVFGAQTRIGADTAIDITPLIQLQPSFQLASQGFAGASLNLQVGDTWYGYAGIGRTNLRPFFNLNFDPNDALSFGTGHRTLAGDTYSLYLIADDRLHTQQRDWHVSAQTHWRQSRVTLDLLRKSGLSDAGPIAAWGCAATWDFSRWFVRLARDPYQNFTAQSAWRIAAGARF